MATPIERHFPPIIKIAGRSIDRSDLIKATLSYTPFSEYMICSLVVLKTQDETITLKDFSAIEAFFSDNQIGQDHTKEIKAEWWVESERKGLPPSKLMLPQKDA